MRGARDSGSFQYPSPVRLRDVPLRAWVLLLSDLPLASLCVLVPLAAHLSLVLLLRPYALGGGAGPAATVAYAAFQMLSLQFAAAVHVAGVSGLASGFQASVRHVGARPRILAVSLGFPALLAAPTAGLYTYLDGFGPVLVELPAVLALAAAACSALALPLYLTTSSSLRPLRFFVSRSWAGLRLLLPFSAASLLLSVVSYPAVLLFDAAAGSPPAVSFLLIAVSVVYAASAYALFVLSCFLLTLRALPPSPP